MHTKSFFLWAAVLATGYMACGQDSPAAPSASPIVLHAARLLDVEAGKIVTPGEILVQGQRISAIGSSVPHPEGAQVIDLGDTTLMPGLIDAHVHLFLHPGAEDLQRRWRRKPT